jgi:signal transduction histidine kinase
MTNNDGTATVEVTDSGEGIAPENVEKIFDPFFTTKDSGTGLGLAITSKIMQAHDGYIKARSEKGKGSTFSLLFPREASSEQSRVARAGDASPAASCGRSGS